MRQRACVTPNHTTPTHAHVLCKVCPKISMSARMNQCRQQDASVGQVSVLFCSSLPTATNCIGYTERLASAACRVSPKRGPSCPSRRTQGHAQVHQGVTPNRTTATTTTTHAHISCQVCQKISVSARTNQCRQRDASVGQVSVLFCSSLPTATSCIRYTERLWGMGGKLKTSRRAWCHRRCLPRLA